MNVTRRKGTVSKALSVILAFALVLGNMVSGNLIQTEASGGHTCTYVNGICTDIGCTQPYEAPEGDGSEENPYQIGNAGQLYYFAGIVNGDAGICTGTEGAPLQNTGACAVLTNHIVLNEGTVNGVNDSLKQWTPIGKDYFNRYTGVFDGGKFTISGLYINCNDFYQGLFGVLDGEVKNLGIENSYIKGNSETGSIAGSSNIYLEILNCYSTATVEAQCYVGGFVGHVSGTIENSYFAGTCLEGVEDKVPGSGISGKETTGTHINCYVLSGNAVTADKDGVELRTAEQFASGQVAYELNGEQAEVVWGQTLSEEGVSAEAVEIMPVLGGSPVYEIIEKACPGIDDESAVKPGKYTNDEALRYRYTYPEHDYDLDDNGEDDVYRCTSCNLAKEHECISKDGFCTLCGDVMLEKPEGDGTIVNPYKIAHGGHLAWFGQNASGSYQAKAILTEDIYLNPEGMTAGSVNAFQWNMIDSYESGNIFDGQGHTIYGLCYNGSEDFAFVENNRGTIQNITFAGVSIVSDFNWAQVAAVSVNNQGIIDGVTIKGQIDAKYSDEAAGICAENDGTIKNCVNYASITGYEDATGICGYNSEGIIHNCINYGKIAGNRLVSGICGSGYEGSIDSSKNYGTISAEGDHAGGILGYSEGDTIEKCINYGNVYAGDDSAGGICGYVEEESKFKQCGNMGDVVADDEQAGGICGYVDESCEIIQCYNIGDVVADEEAGGMVGDVNADCSMAYCYNAGQIRAGSCCGKHEAGGIVGDTNDAEDVRIENCYYMEGSADTATGIMEVEYCEDYEEAIKNYEEPEGVEAECEEAFSSGKIAWLLNERYGEIWLYQTLTGEAVQAYPESEGEGVARKAHYGCSEAKEPIHEEFFNGEEDIITYKYKVHNYNTSTLTCTECGKVLPHLCLYGTDGYCKICHGFTVPEGEGTEESPYEIGNVAELYWFAGIVNGDEDVCKDEVEKNNKACAVLTDDIVVNEGPLSEETTDAAVWIPMGIVDEDDWDVLEVTAYNGTFDGNGYSISGIYVPYDMDDSSGFFGVVGEDGLVKDVQLKNVYIKGDNNAGGICNYSLGKIEGCSVTGKISAMEYAGGITSGVEGGFASVYGCSNRACVEGGNAGGIVGEIYGGEIVGCYDKGVMIVSGQAVGSKCVGERYAGFVDGCYYLADEGAASEEVIGEVAATEEEFASGAVTYKMNQALKAAELKIGYGQVLTTDKAQKNPVWGENTMVYAVGTASCPGVAVQNATGYSNDASVVQYQYKDHLYEEDSYFCSFCGNVKEHDCEYEDGYCKYCSTKKAPQGDGTKENPYQISNVDELYWFRDKVSGDLPGETADKKACAVLVNNIDISATDVSGGAIEQEWKPIGVSEGTGKVLEYNGTFDGQGYTISGVAVETDEYNGKLFGFFGKIGKNGVVENLHIAEAYQYMDSGYYEDDLSDDERYLGAFCSTNAGIISGCSIDVEFSAKNENIWYHMAGFAGLNTGTIANCTLYGAVYGIVDGDYAWNYVAGFCGVNEGNLEGCCNDADVDGYYETGGICYKNRGTIEACYNAGDVYSESYYATGICCYNNGTIENCWNEGTVDGFDAHVVGISYENNGTIKNSWNEGDIYSECYGAAGVCYENYGTVDRCWNEGEVYSEEYYASGISRYNYGVLTNCYNVGEIYSDYQYSVGICYLNYGKMAYCYNANWADYALFYENSEGGTVSYCYLDSEKYRYEWYGYYETKPEHAGSKGSGEFADGSVAYALNQPQGENVFGQTLYAEDASGVALVSPEAVQYYPVIGGQTVYPHGNAACPGVEGDVYYAEIIGFSNTEATWEYEYPNHCYDADGDEADDSMNCVYCGYSKEHTCSYENGICSICGWYEAPEGDGSEEYPYTISNAGQLYYFAHVVEGISMGSGTVNGNAAACAVLVDDIDMSQAYDVSGEAVVWSAIGMKNGTVYEGNFDGQGYTIDGLYCDDTVAALFAKTGENAVVQNLTLANCGLYGGATAGITVVNEGTVENCSVDGRIETCEVNLNPDDTETYKEYMEIQNKLNIVRKLYDNQFDFGVNDSSEYMAGGICAVNRGNIGSSWVNGCVISVDKAGFICGDNNGEISNCYYYKNIDEQTEEYIEGESLVVGKAIGNRDKKGQAQAVTYEEIQSGKAAWMLDTDNKYEGNKGIWKKDVNTCMPTLATEDAVTLYYLQLTFADGSIQEHYVTADAVITDYLMNTDGYKWVYDGGIVGLGDGTDYTGTIMDVDVLILREVEAPVVTPEPGDSSSPAPSESTSPAPSESTSPAPSESTSPLPSGSTSPAPSGSTSPQPSGSASPAPSESTSPQPSESTNPQPGPSTSTEPGTSEEPNPGPTTSPDPTDSSNPGPVPSDDTTPSPEPSDDVKKGDVDDNGKVELSDAQMALKMALKIIANPTEQQVKAADVDNDGKVTLADAQLILKYALKIINKFE